MVRVRIAPSPTGEDFHIGNAYTALLNFVFARKHGGKFIVRIEDTDRMRFVSGSEQHILASLQWLGLTHDEGPVIGGPFGPYRQSERLPIYQKYAKDLIARGHAYYCFCTPAVLEAMREDQKKRGEVPHYDGRCKKILDAGERIAGGERYVIRLNVPKDGITTFMDVIRGEIRFDNKLIDDQVLLKSDGFPTYHLAVVIDDYLMQITHIIRGEDWISSTPKHILLYQFFGWKIPIYAHLPLLRNPDKSKLSKRKNPVWVSWYREQGFLPEAVINYLSLMGWSHPSGKEIFSTSELIKEFTLERVQVVGPVFDIEKLTWLNGEYIRMMTKDKIASLIASFYGITDKSTLIMVKSLIPLVKERMKLLTDWVLLTDFFFKDELKYQKDDFMIKDLTSDQVTEALKKITESMEKISHWSKENLEMIGRSLSVQLGLSPSDLFMIIRIATTGKRVGPPLFESLALLEKNRTLNRLEKALTMFS